MSYLKYLYNTLCTDFSDINEEFEKRAEEAKQKWINAKALPRKQKKRVRKECQIDYSCYKGMIEWNSKYTF